MNTVSQVVAGLDIAKDRIDVCLMNEAIICRTFSMEEADSLAVWLGKVGVELAVAEPTGGYEAPVIKALDQAGVALAVVNARQIRDFARATGLLAKTDRLDARVMAEYAARLRPEPRPRRSSVRQRLCALVRRRRQLVDMRKAELIRRHQTREDDIAEDIDACIAFLNIRIKKIGASIANLVKTDQTLATHDRLVRSMPGVGPVAAASLLAELPELGTLSRRKVAALVGLAPHARDSGAFRGRRTIWGGRAALRNSLHMGVIATIRRDNPFGDTYRKLRSKGKPHKVATTAVLRKMIVQLNAMIRDQNPYSPHQQHSC